MPDFFNNDDLLFHYTKANIAIERILLKKELKLSRIDLMDDPREALDFSLVIVGGGIIDPKNLHDIKLHTEFISKISAEFSSTVKRSKIASFCCQEPIEGNVFSYGCCKPRMWSQYGDSHQGICLIFSKKDTDNLFEESEYSFYSDAVKYNNIDLNDIDVRTLDAEKSIQQHVKEFRSNLFFLKAEDFQDEKEYRYVVDDNDITNVSLKINIKDSLKAIVTSYRYPTAFELNIKDYCNKYGVPWYRVNWFHGTPSLQKLHDGVEALI